jgi:hypothetical protein
MLAILYLPVSSGAREKSLQFRTPSPTPIPTIIYASSLNISAYLSSNSPKQLPLSQNFVKLFQIKELSNKKSRNPSLNRDMKRKIFGFS